MAHANHSLEQTGPQRVVNSPVAWPGHRTHEQMADLRAILRLIETGALDEAAEAIDCLDTLVRDQIPIRLYDAIVPGK